MSSASTPPVHAIGMLMMTRIVSIQCLTALYVRNAMRSSVSGMMICRRPSASCSSLISPAHSRRMSYGRQSLFQPGRRLVAPRDLAVDALLRLGDRAGEVAPAHAELHRRVADAVLAVDRSPGPRPPGCRRSARAGPATPSGVETVISRMASRLIRYCGFQRTVRSKNFSPSYTSVTACPPMAAWMTASTSPGVQAVARAHLALRGDLDARLPERR